MSLSYAMKYIAAFQRVHYRGGPRPGSVLGTETVGSAIDLGFTEEVVKRVIECLRTAGKTL